MILNSLEQCLHLKVCDAIRFANITTIATATIGISTTNKYFMYSSPPSKPTSLRRRLRRPRLPCVKGAVSVADCGIDNPSEQAFACPPSLTQGRLWRSAS